MKPFSQITEKMDKYSIEDKLSNVDKVEGLIADVRAIYAILDRYLNPKTANFENSDKCFFEYNCIFNGNTGYSFYVQCYDSITKRRGIISDYDSNLVDNIESEIKKLKLNTDLRRYKNYDDSIGIELWQKD